MGAHGEDLLTTLGRNGSVPYVISEDITIPAESVPIEISFTSKNGEKVAPLRGETTGMKHVVIAGVQGNITLEDDTYFYRRGQKGGEVKVKKGTEIITSGSLEALNYIPVICLSQADGTVTSDEIIAYQKGIISHQQTADAIKDRYLIIGDPFGSEETLKEQETVMEAEYGLNYINLRQYLLTQGLADAGITATEEDKECLAAGKIPASLLDGESRLNEVSYELLGELVYERMRVLGYFDEVESAIHEAMTVD